MRPSFACASTMPANAPRLHATRGLVIRRCSAPRTLNPGGPVPTGFPNAVVVSPRSAGPNTEALFCETETQVKTIAMIEMTNRIAAADGAALAARTIPPIRLAQTRRLCNAQLALPPVPRRPACRSTQSARAAQHAAEFADWQLSGGDFLCSKFVALFLRAHQARTP